MDSTPHLFDLVPDALVLVDGAGRIVRANANAERLFGYPPQGLDALEIEQLIPAGMRERHRGHRAAYMREPRVRPMGGANMNLVGQRRDGRQFPVEIALSPLIHDDVRCYLASVRDVSESQRVRQALVRARYDATAAAIGHLALAAQDTMALVDRLPPMLAEVLQVQQVAAVILQDGLPMLSAASGMGAAQDDAPPEWMQSADSPVLRALAHGSAETMDDPGYSADGDRCGRNDGAVPRWPAGARSGVVVPLQDRDRPIGALLALDGSAGRFGHDELQLLQTVANLLSAQVQRRRTEELLAHAQRLEALGQLTGGVAHDFNNLLTVVSGSLQLLQDEYGTRPGAREVIETALRSVGRGAELTAKLLAFGRRQHLRPRAVRPRPLLEDLVLMLRRTLGEGIHIDLGSEEEVPAVYADPAQLEAALLNLALNARDAMPDGGRIAIGARERWVTREKSHPALQPGHYVVFSVVDNGAGMAPQVLARALEPFYSTKPAGRGSGLGLSMVYGFVSQSGGYLDLSSQLGQGTRVELHLPAAPAGAEDAGGDAPSNA